MERQRFKQNIPCEEQGENTKTRRGNFEGMANVGKLTRSKRPEDANILQACEGPMYLMTREVKGTLLLTNVTFNLFSYIHLDTFRRIPRILERQSSQSFLEKIENVRPAAI